MSLQNILLARDQLHIVLNARGTRQSNSCIAKKIFHTIQGLPPSLACSQPTNWLPASATKGALGQTIIETSKCATLQRTCQYITKLHNKVNNERAIGSQAAPFESPELLSSTPSTGSEWLPEIQFVRMKVAMEQACWCTSRRNESFCPILVSCFPKA